MAHGFKVNETRSWSTNYRGPVAICSALKEPGPVTNPALRRYVESVDPIGCVLCVVELRDVMPTTAIDMIRVAQFLESDSAWESEFALGDYSTGRFAWLTRNRRLLRVPVPVIGRQGLFTLPIEVELKVRGQI